MLPKSIKGLEEKIENLKTLKHELGSKKIYTEMDEIDSFLQEKIKVLESLDDGLRLQEPNDYNDIMKQCSPKELSFDLSKEMYKSKLKGAMFGRFAGCALGAPVELLSIGELEFFAKEIGQSFPPTSYWKKAPSGYFPRYKVGRGNHFTVEEMNFLSADDDIAYTFLSLLILEEYGTNFSTNDMAKAWLKYLPRECTFTAERTTLDNLKNGINPMIAAETNNYEDEYIGAYIRCDGWAYVNPGDPLKASKMAYRDAFLSHRRSGIYSAMYFAAVIALAFTSDDIEKTLIEGLDYIPKNTDFYDQIKWAIEYFPKIQNYKDANEVVSQRFSNMSWVHATNNACLTVWGIMLGQNDFTKGISETVAMAYDNDCTAATVGSVLGAYLGIEKIEKLWYMPWNNVALSYLNGIEKFDLSSVLERFYNITYSNK